MTLPVWRVPQAPCEDEVLSSFLVRNAHANGLTAGMFTRIFWPKRQIWNVDVDRSCDDSLASSIAFHSGVPVERVREMRLASFGRTLGAAGPKAGIDPWILAIGCHWRHRNRHGLQYCPLCLSEDDRPFYRRIWRLAFVVVCPLHRVRLLDACPRCSAPLLLHWTAPRRIARCASCGWALTDTGRAGLPEAPDRIAALAAIQDRLLESVEWGQPFLGGQPLLGGQFFPGGQPHLRGQFSPEGQSSLRGQFFPEGQSSFRGQSFLRGRSFPGGQPSLVDAPINARECFSVLRRLAAVASARPVEHRLREFLGLSDTGRDLPEPDPHGSRQVEMARWEYRAGVLEILSRWTEDWPATFLRGCAAAGLTQRSFRSGWEVPSALSMEVQKLPTGVGKRRILSTGLQRRIARLKELPPSLYRTERAGMLFALAARRAS